MSVLQREVRDLCSSASPSNAETSTQHNTAPHRESNPGPKYAAAALATHCGNGPETCSRATPSFSAVQPASKTQFFHLKKSGKDLLWKRSRLLLHRNEKAERRSRNKGIKSRGG